MLLPAYLLLLSLCVCVCVCVRRWCAVCVLFLACCLQFLQFCCACCFLFLFFLTTCWCCGCYSLCMCVCVEGFLSTSFTLCNTRVYVCVCKDTSCSTLARVPLKCAQGCWLVRKNVTCGLPKLLASPTGRVIEEEGEEEDGEGNPTATAREPAVSLNGCLEWSTPAHQAKDKWPLKWHKVLAWSWSLWCNCGAVVVAVLVRLSGCCFDMMLQLCELLIIYCLAALQQQQQMLSRVDKQHKPGYI